MIFCTLFNWAYVAQGVTLYRSIERHLRDDFVLYALCMDELAALCLQTLNLPNLRIINLTDIEDAALLAVKPHRTLGEYCWTCTTPLLLYVQDLFHQGTVVTYVDADIAFFSSPSAITRELGEKSIFIHEHDFAPEHQGLLAQSGRFNVGVVSFRKDAEGRTCLERWKSQCIDECVMDPAAGKCGDQNYLDEWPELYTGLVISADPGVGLAPWNISKRAIGRDHGGAIRVDQSKAVFYHFHGLRPLRPRFGINPTLIASGGYRLPEASIDMFYSPYVQEVWRNMEPFAQIVAALKPLPDIFPRMEDDQILFLSRRGMLPVQRNAATMSELYGFDEARPDRRPV